MLLPPHSYLCINYHIIFFPKYRHCIFKGELEPEQELSKCFKVICHNYGYDLIEQEITPYYVHLFVSAPPTVAPVDIVRELKSISVNSIFQDFPTLKQSTFWGSGYYIGTVSVETIEKYIENQKLV